MNQITVIGLDGQQKQIEFEVGDNLMEVLRDAGYDESSSRLSCQIPMTGDQSGMTVQIVETD